REKSCSKRGTLRRSCSLYSEVPCKSLSSAGTATWCLTTPGPALSWASWQCYVVSHGRLRYAPGKTLQLCNGAQQLFEICCCVTRFSRNGFSENRCEP